MFGGVSFRVGSQGGTARWEEAADAEAGGSQGKSDRDPGAGTGDGERAATAAGGWAAEGASRDGSRDDLQRAWCVRGGASGRPAGEWRWRTFPNSVWAGVGR